MAMLGSAALAMWWDMAPDMRAEFEDWHTHEHFPERLSLPGFLRASRWAQADGGEGFFVLYELAEHGVLASPEYVARLNAPTSWSRKLMPHHANMVRSQCAVLESVGAVAASFALTLRFSPGEHAQALREDLRHSMLRLAATPGLAGAHLLLTDAPRLAPTVEQQIRGNADRQAEAVFMVCGYARAALEAVELPALSGSERDLYGLSLCMVGAETSHAREPAGRPIVFPRT